MTRSPETRFVTSISSSRTSRLPRAFSYDWRLWTLPELREVLAEAGFRRSTVYWESSDEHTCAGNGVFLPVEKGEPDAGWIAYLVVEK